MLRDTVQSYRLLDAELLSAASFPGKELGGATPCSGGAASVKAWRKTNTESYAPFSSFSVKVKILFEFLLVGLL